MLYLRLLHHSLVGRCCVYVCYSTPSLEGAVSAFASPSHSLKVLYLCLLQQSLIGMCCIYVCFSQSFIKSVVSAFATSVPHWKVLCLSLLHHSLIERCCKLRLLLPIIKSVVSVFATPVPYLKGLCLRLLHHSLIGMRCIYVFFSQSFIKICIYVYYTSPSLEGVVSAFAVPVPLHHWKVLYLRLLHQSLNGRCCIYVCFTQTFIKMCIYVYFTSPSLEGVVSAFATPLPHWKVLYLRLLLPVIH